MSQKMKPRTITISEYQSIFFMKVLYPADWKRVLKFDMIFVY